MFVIRFAWRDSQLRAAEGSVHCRPGHRLRGEYSQLKSIIFCLNVHIKKQLKYVFFKPNGILFQP